jgi:hypothetical protein
MVILMGRTFFIWISLVLSMMTSCVKELPSGQTGEKPDAYFVNAFICSDSLARVQLGKVSGISEGYEFTADAAVTLVVSGQRFPMTYRGAGWYENGLFSSMPGDSVLLEVVRGNVKFGKSIQVPSRVSISNVQTFPVVVGFSGRTLGFRLRFVDSAVQENYYRLWVVERYMKYLTNSAGTINDSLILERKLPISGNELSFLRNPYNVYANREVLFSDETFNGLNTVIEFHRSLALKSDERTLTYRVVFENISEALFTYYNMRNAHIWQQSSITQTPTTVKGNLEGVYGIFGAYQVAEYVVVF